MNHQNKKNPFMSMMIQTGNYSANEMKNNYYLCSLRNPRLKSSYFIFASLYNLGYILNFGSHIISNYQISQKKLFGKIYSEIFFWRIFGRCSILDINGGI